MQNLLAVVVVLHVQGSLPRSGSYNRSSFGSERVRLVVGGSLQSDSPVVNIFKGYNPNGVKFITAAGINPALDAVTIEGFFLEAGVKAQWIPVHSTNCAERTNDPYYVSMVEEAGITLTTFRSARNHGWGGMLRSISPKHNLIGTPSHQGGVLRSISSKHHLIRAPYAVSVPCLDKLC